MLNMLTGAEVNTAGTEMATFKLGNLPIETLAYSSQGSAILGIRDSGKTYTATLLAEKVFEAGVPFIAFDPIGVWRFLRVPGKGRGYPIVVAGGQEGDLPLTVTGAPEIVRSAMHNGVSLVIDLFDINLSKADWKRIVTACVRVLLHENSRHGLRHIFIEEAAEFAPQRVGPDQGQVYAEMEKLARMGGNSRLGYTLINQRAEEVNKAVLELCDNLFLHRQKGRNSLTALSKWLDIGNVKDADKIITTLSTLPTGECWAWLAGTEHAVRVKVPEKNSLHPDRRVMRGEKGVKVKAAVDVGSFVEQMRATLTTVEEEAKANDPKELRAEIARLKKQMASAVQQQIVPDPLAIEQAEQHGYARGHKEGYMQALEIAFADTKARAIGAISEMARAGAAYRYEPPKNISESCLARLARPPAPFRNGTTVGVRPADRPKSIGGSAMPGGHRKILTALAQYLQGRAKNQVAVLTGYAVNGGAFGNYLSALRTSGYIEGHGQNLRITQEGLSALGSYEPLPTGRELQALWLSQLGRAERLALEVLLRAYPQPLTKAELAERTGYAAEGGGFGNALSRLRTLELISGRSELRASDNLF